jgi:hypothetical protein
VPGPPPPARPHCPPRPPPLRPAVNAAPPRPTTAPSRVDPTRPPRANQRTRFVWPDLHHTSPLHTSAQRSRPLPRVPIRWCNEPSTRCATVLEERVLHEGRGSKAASGRVSMFSSSKTGSTRVSLASLPKQRSETASGDGARKQRSEQSSEGLESARGRQLTALADSRTHWPSFSIGTSGAYHFAGSSPLSEGFQGSRCKTGAVPPL